MGEFEPIRPVTLLRLAAAALAMLCPLGVLAGPAPKSVADTSEVRFPDEQFKQLDTFEAKALEMADSAFAKADFKLAHALYDAFVLEYGKSRAIAYALLRKGRCLDRLDQRHKAIEEYQAVLDYFPNQAAYAAPAIYHQGQCHWANGDEDKALARWAELAKDAEYARHPLAGPALLRLAEQLDKRNQPAGAAECYVKIAINFRETNKSAASAALAQAIRYYVRVSPNEPKLRQLYQQAGPFGSGKQPPPGASLDNDRDYWSAVMAAVRGNNAFPADQAEARDRYCRFWADLMDGRFPEWDDFQLDVAALRLAHEKDKARWAQRLDELFARNQKPGDFDRVLRWIGLFASDKAKAKEYYAKLDFAKMSNNQIFAAMKLFYETVGDADIGRNVFGKLRLVEMSDAERVPIERFFWKKDEALVAEICGGFKNGDLGRMELLRFYRAGEDAAKGVALAKKMETVPAYASEAVWIRAELLRVSGQYEQAILAYRACDNPPENIWPIASCYASLGKLEPAVAELRQVETFFGDRYGSRAAMAIAHLYRQFKMNKQHVAALRGVLKKYPGSRESSQAHVELERMGVSPGGGEDAKGK